MELFILFGMVLLQNASFTLVSRARNSSSIAYHAGAAMLSNGVWLLVLREIVLKLDSLSTMATYVVAATLGSVLMHYVSMHVFEKKLKKAL